MTAMMRRDPESGLLIVESDAEIPAFQTEDDAASFWSTHTLSDALLDECRPIGDLFASDAEDANA
ncbi:MAG: hypothetical protein IT302_07690 [Dehalococcoidia bacterium]|nr:hypothetical protein [Dehalococcoidia bacterium]